MSRLLAFQSLLKASSFFKLVCGAGNENANEVEYLAYIYTLAGCTGFDVSCAPDIVNSAFVGIDKAMRDSLSYNIKVDIRPFIISSVGMPGDHHVRKAIIDHDKCVNCNLCIPVCPTEAIPDSLNVISGLCIGCGNCESVCPPAANAIKYEHNAKELQTLLPQVLQAGAESIELHAGVPDDSTTLNEWGIVCDAVQDGMVSICLDRFHLSNMHLVERIKLAHEVAKDRLIVQADGIPMSGGSDDYNTTLQAVSIADIINKELKLKDIRYRNIPVLISGGTNSYTGILARTCNVPFNGITIGTHARKLVSPFRSHDDRLDADKVLAAVAVANTLITTNLGS